MTIDLMKVLKLLSILEPLIFTHQSAVFLDRAVRDIYRGRNGYSKGLTLLIIGLIGGASVSAVDGTIRVLKDQYMPKYTILTRVIAYIFMIIGMHIINNQLNKEDE